MYYSLLCAQHIYTDSLNRVACIIHFLVSTLFIHLKPSIRFNNGSLWCNNNTSLIIRTHKWIKIKKYVSFITQNIFMNTCACIVDTDGILIKIQSKKTKWMCQMYEIVCARNNNYLVRRTDRGVITTILENWSLKRVKHYIYIHKKKSNKYRIMQTLEWNDSTMTGDEVGSSFLFLIQIRAYIHIMIMCPR